ncbi:hypothetical protein Tco_1571777, partial [Tanacetum coccineum]
MQAAVHETGPPGDGATISDEGLLFSTTPTFWPSFRRHLLFLVVMRMLLLLLLPPLILRLLVFLKAWFEKLRGKTVKSWTHGAQTLIVAHGTVSNCSRARITTRSVIGLHLFTPVRAFSNILTA